MSNKELVEELYKPLINKLGKEKYTKSLQTILGVLILLVWNCYVNLIKEFVFFTSSYSKYGDSWVIPLNDKKRNYNY